jgi:putative ECF transporter S component (TIGR02185 family)
MKNKKKLKGKDLINIGIYAAIYCVIMTAVAMLGFIPIMMPLLCVIVPIFGGIPYMLFLTKVDKFGMITIYAMIVGLFLWITGMGYWPFIFGIICGVITDLIVKSGNYKSSKKNILSCGVDLTSDDFKNINLDEEVKFDDALFDQFLQTHLNLVGDLFTGIEQTQVAKVEKNEKLKKK